MLLLRASPSCEHNILRALALALHRPHNSSKKTLLLRLSLSLLSATFCPFSRLQDGNGAEGRGEIGNCRGLTLALASVARGGGGLREKGRQPLARLLGHKFLHG